MKKLGFPMVRTVGLACGIIAAGLTGCVAAANSTARADAATAQAVTRGNAPLNERLKALSHLPGLWISDEVMTRGDDGRRFVLITEYTSDLDGAVLLFSNYLAYESGSIEKQMTGIYIWSPSKDTIVHFAGLNDSSVVHDAEYIKESLAGDSHELRFLYSSSSGSVSEWKSVDTLQSDGSFKTVGSYKSGEEWKVATDLTMRRIDAFPDTDDRISMIAERLGRQEKD